MLTFPGFCAELLLFAFEILFGFETAVFHLLLKTSADAL
jgi:hypothetical protein